MIKIRSNRKRLPPNRIIIYIILLALLLFLIIKLPDMQEWIERLFAI